MTPGQICSFVDTRLRTQNHATSAGYDYDSSNYNFALSFGYSIPSYSLQPSLTELLPSFPSMPLQIIYLFLSLICLSQDRSAYAMDAFMDLLRQLLIHTFPQKSAHNPEIPDPEQNPLLLQPTSNMTGPATGPTSAQREVKRLLRLSPPASLSPSLTNSPQSCGTFHASCGALSDNTYLH